MIPSCVQLLCRWRGNFSPAERNWFISPAAQRVNSSLALNRIRLCFLPIIRSAYFHTDFHTAALLLWMYRYLSHFVLPPPSPWLGASARCRQLSRQVSVNLSDAQWRKMERLLPAAVFILFSAFSRTVLNEMLSRTLPAKGAGRSESGCGSCAAAQ